MKRLIILFIFFLSFLISGCSTKEHVTPKNQPFIEHPETIEFNYQEVEIYEKEIKIIGYLSNYTKETISPYSLYLKLYDDETTYAEDTLLFNNDFIIKGKMMERVAITMSLNQKLTMYDEFEIEYHYELNESPINEKT